MMTGVLRWVPQRTVIGTVIKVFRFFPSRTRRHAGVEDRVCLRVLCSFVCIARCMANDDGNGIAQQQNAFKQLSTGQWDVSTTFFCFPSVSHRSFASLPCRHISYSLCAFVTRCFCTVKSRRLVCNLPPLTLTDTSGMSWQAAITCYLHTYMQAAFRIHQRC
jgi:hypothetical protein